MELDQSNNMTKDLKSLRSNLVILHIIDRLDPNLGGVASAVATMAKGLTDAGTENHIVCSESDPDYANSLTGIQIHQIGLGKTSWSYNSGWKPWLIRHLLRYDVVILHGLWLYPGYALRKVVCKFITGSADKKILPRIVCMPHGMLDPYFQNAKTRRLKAIRNSIYWKLIESKLFRITDTLLFTSNEERILAGISHKPYSPKHEVVLALGVESPPAESAEMHKALEDIYPAKKNRSFVLFLGRIHEKKGLDILLSGYAKFVSWAQHQRIEYPQLLIAGPGLSDPFGQKLIKRVFENHDLRENVTFLHMLHNNEKWATFYAADAFILPSFQENFGIAVVEAMACNKPVLISDQINIWPDIIEAKCGLVEKATIQGVENMLMKWCRSTLVERELMSLQARRLFERKFSVLTASQALVKSFLVNKHAMQ